MNRIVQAINTMIGNEYKITNLFNRDNEIFFLYLNKQKWSIEKLENYEDGENYYQGRLFDQFLNELLKVDELKYLYKTWKKS